MRLKQHQRTATPAPSVLGEALSYCQLGETTPKNCNKRHLEEYQDKVIGYTSSKQHQRTATYDSISVGGMIRLAYIQETTPKNCNQSSCPDRTPLQAALQKQHQRTATHYPRAPQPLLQLHPCRNNHKELHCHARGRDLSPSRPSSRSRNNLKELQQHHCCDGASQKAARIPLEIVIKSCKVGEGSWLGSWCLSARMKRLKQLQRSENRDVGSPMSLAFVLWPLGGEGRAARHLDLCSVCVV